MNTGETLDHLINAENYVAERVKISDEFIEMAKVMLPNYRFIAEKEEHYQGLLLTLNKLSSNTLFVIPS